MKKLFVLVPCFAVLLFLGNMSFAQEAAAIDAEVPPCTCQAGAPALPFVYPGYQPAVSGRIVTILGKRSETRATKERGARRAARLAHQPLPGPVPTMFPPGFVSAPLTGAAAGVVPQLPGNLMGDANKVYQRASVGGAPVINFLSVVRAPRPYYDPAVHSYQTSPIGYPAPAAE